MTFNRATLEGEAVGKHWVVVPVRPDPGKIPRMPPTDPTARELFEVLARDHADALMASIRTTIGRANADDVF